MGNIISAEYDEGPITNPITNPIIEPITNKNTDMMEESKEESPSPSPSPLPLSPLPTLDTITNPAAFWSLLGYIAIKVETSSQTYFRPDITMSLATSTYSDMVLHRAIYALMLNPLASREYPPLCYISDRMYHYANNVAIYAKHLIAERTSPLTHEECQEVIQDAMNMADITDYVAIQNGEYGTDDTDEEADTTALASVPAPVPAPATTTTVPAPPQSAPQTTPATTPPQTTPAPHLTPALTEEFLKDLANEPADIRDQVIYNHNGMTLPYVTDWVFRREFNVPSSLPESPSQTSESAVTDPSHSNRMRSSQTSNSRSSTSRSSRIPKESLVSPTTQVIRRSARIAAQRNAVVSTMNY